MAVAVPAAAAAPRLKPVDLAALPGFAADDHGAAFDAFLVSCRSIAAAEPPLRAGLAPSPALVAVCRAALRAEPAAASAFFTDHFQAFALEDDGFLTGYYEPQVDGALTPEPGFATPLLARPHDLITLADGETFEGLAAAGRGPDGGLFAYPDRAAIDAGALGARARPLVYVRDPIEAFMIHVQGSARVRLADGRVLRLTYAGRNGRPYSSIGKALVDQGGMPLADMTLARLKQWVRDHGQGPGEAGRALIERNQSYIFFKREDAVDPALGPIGGAGAPLTPLRSIAIDRTVWAYGLPFFVDAALPWREAGRAEPFQRVMIAQDTGTAIVGPARVDLFFGSGDAAGARAGDIRHTGKVYVLLPKAAL